MVKAFSIWDCPHLIHCGRESKVGVFLLLPLTLCLCQCGQSTCTYSSKSFYNRTRCQWIAKTFTKIEIKIKMKTKSDLNRKAPHHHMLLLDKNRWLLAKSCLPTYFNQMKASPWILLASLSFLTWFSSFDNAELDILTKWHSILTHV